MKHFSAKLKLKGLTTQTASKKMLYPRSSAGLFCSLDLLGKPSLAFLPQFLLVEMGFDMCLIWVWALIQEVAAALDIVLKPLQGKNWVHTHPAMASVESMECLSWNGMSWNVCPVKSWKPGLDLSAQLHSGSSGRRRSHILVWCISQQKQLPCQWLSVIPIFFLIALFLTQPLQVMGNSHLQHLLSNAFMCPSSCCIEQSQCTHLELLLFRKFLMSPNMLHPNPGGG